jgi:hypothetical protein
VRKRVLRVVSAAAAVGGLGAGALVLSTATAASAHFTCNDGTTTTIDDPAVACVGHDGIAHEGAGGGPTTEAPDHDHDAGPAPTMAPPTTGRQAAPTTRKATTPTTAKPSTSPAAVAASPRFTG